MRIAFTSDLHVEYHLEVVGLLAEEVARLAPDALVLAGDVCPDLGRLERALHLVTRAVDCPVLFLPGNHELWCGGAQGPGPNSRERYEQVLPALARRAGALPLGTAPERLGPVAFVGVTGWHDGSLGAPVWPLEKLDAPSAIGAEPGPEEQVTSVAPASMLCMDHAQVHWPDAEGAPLSDAALSRLMCEALAEQMERLGDHAGPVVAVTHVLPHPGLLGEVAGTPLAAAVPHLGSRALWPILTSHPRVALVVCGHLHLPRRVLLEGPHGAVPCEISPVGYPREIPGTLAGQVADRLRIVELI